MKVSEGWLRAWANPAADSDALEKQFSMAGLEVDGVEGAAQPLAAWWWGRSRPWPRTRTRTS